MLEFKREFLVADIKIFTLTAVRTRKWGKMRLACFSGFVYEICDKLRDKSLSELQQHQRHYHLSRKLKERAGREDSFEECLLRGTNEFKWRLIIY